MSTKQKRAVVKEEGEFDISKYLISSDLETRVLIIPETGDEIEIKLRPIPWSTRNKIISECLQWQEGGRVDFDGDKYVKHCLTKMIAHAPWGITDDRFLSSIDSRLGTVLENLVPKAFGDETQIEDAANLKKG